MSDRDRRHFASVAAAKRAERIERLREAIARNPAQKIVEGLQLGYAFAATPAIEQQRDRRAFGQAELVLRWRRLYGSR